MSAPIPLPPDLSNYLVSLSNGYFLAGDKTEIIQNLWSDYGYILRVHIQGGTPARFVVKVIRSDSRTAHHPHGWQNDFSHQRKLRSYRVEAALYEHLSQIPLPARARTARLFATKFFDPYQVIVLEDLATAGFTPATKFPVSEEIISAGLTWLAAFHTAMLGKRPPGLWSQGSYWHLETRPQEFQTMPAGILKQNARYFDHLLRDCEFPTIIHGDAKMANFLYRPKDQKMSAVDFQYCGPASCVVDLVGMLSSCLDSRELFEQADSWLHFYLERLMESLPTDWNKEKKKRLQAETLSLYPIAWADFSRFLAGWKPGHWKLNDYSREMTARALERLD